MENGLEMSLFILSESTGAAEACFEKNRTVVPRKMNFDIVSEVKNFISTLTNQRVQFRVVEQDFASKFRFRMPSVFGGHLVEVALFL